MSTATADNTTAFLHGLTAPESLDALLEGYDAADAPDGRYSYGAGRRALPRHAVLRAVGHLLNRLGHSRPDETMLIEDPPANALGWSALLVNDCEKVCLGHGHLRSLLLFQAAVAPSGKMQAQFVGRCGRA